MKAISVRRYAGILFVTSLNALLQTGCHTERQTESVQTSGPTSSLHSVIASSTKSAAQSRVEIIVHYVAQPKPFSFQIEDQIIGTDTHALLDRLHGMGVTDVIFDSEYKLTAEGVRDLVQQINQSGFVIKQFWIPHSTSPGRVDVLNGN